MRYRQEECGRFVSMQIALLNDELTRLCAQYDAMGGSVFSNAAQKERDGISSVYSNLELVKHKMRGLIEALDHAEFFA